MAICMSGDLDPEKQFPLIDEYFGKFPKRKFWICASAEEPILSPAKPKFTMTF